MLFNSIEFLIFLAIVFTLYWFVFNKSLKLQNVFLALVSYVFYGWWDWRFLLLLWLSSSVDFIVGVSLDNTNVERKRKWILGLSLAFNLGLLGFFKYFNFFIDSFSSLMETLGFQVNPVSLNVILPVGISFYTFQSLSYTIEVYRRKIQPTRDIISFFAFVSFFPQLVAGPINRACSLLPQFFEKRQFQWDDATDGIKQMLWGFFKKIVIADCCALNVNYIFSHYQELNSLTLVLGVVFFAFQIYCDFSGYSDIAIGTAKLFGFKLMRNFAYPYFSENIIQFWHRWHISLSTWFRDYVYIPLGGNRVSTARQLFNLIVTFTISGFWHGANWTFVIWGFLNGIAYIPVTLLNKGKKKISDVAEQITLLPTLRQLSGIIITFTFVLFTWIFFRSANLNEALSYISHIFSSEISSGFISDLQKISYSDSILKSIVFILLLILTEWLQRDKEHPLMLPAFPKVVRWSIYYVVAQIILLFGQFGSHEFIYFQF